MIKKTIGIIALFTAAYGVFWITSKRHDLRNFPGIISSFYSKEMCSCLFVSGQTEEFCNNYARQWVPIQGSPVVDRERKAVRVTGLFRTNEAVYTGEKTGCVLRTGD